MWTDVFSKYLEKEFLGYWGNLCDNRNHIAHNKLIDIKNYKKALRNIENINKGIESAKQKFEELKMSNEKIEEIEKDIDEEKEFLDSLIESEAGVCIRNKYEIEELFLGSISEFKDNIMSNFDYNSDVIINNSEIDFNNSNHQILLEATSNFLKNRAVKIDVVDISISDEEGTDSEIKLKIIYINDKNSKEDYIRITYTNGKASFNKEGGYYMPETQDEMNIVELQEVEEKIREFCEENFPSKEDLIEKYQEEGCFYNEVYCNSCGEETIISKESLEFKKDFCLSCMTQNSIVKCSRCNNLTIEKNKDDVNFCDDCMAFISSDD